MSIMRVLKAINKRAKEKQTDKEIKLDKKKTKGPLWLSVLTVIMTVYDFIVRALTSIFGIIFAIIIFLICVVGFIRDITSPFGYYHYSSDTNYSCFCNYVDDTDIHLQTDGVVIYL